MKQKKINSKNKEEIEESELEKELEKTNEEPEFEITEENSRVSSNVKAPVLEKISNMQEIPIRFDSNLNSSGISERKENEEDGFKYIKNANGEEPKYQNYEGVAFSNFHARSEVEDFGRRDLFQKRNVGFAASPESKPVEINFEKYETPEKVERETLGRNIFERRDIKYKPSR